jgi:UDP-N-acetylglucosamine 1-carboxyvinyltransferase
MNDTLTLNSAGQPVSGEIRISGFKHALVLAVAYAIGTGRVLRLGNVPDILETAVYLRLLPDIGVQACYSDGTLSIDATGPVLSTLPPSSEQIHGSLYLLPALLARNGYVRFTDFGGCRIGDGGGRARPWRHVTRIAELFGGRFTSGGGTAMLRADQLRGTEVDLRDFTTDPVTLAGPEYTGAAKAAILTAALASGDSVLRYPYLKLEVLALLDLLREAGVGIDVHGDTAEIRGTGGRLGGSHAAVLPADLMEVVTWTTIAVTTGGSVDLTGVRDEEINAGLGAERELWRSAGVELTAVENGVRVTGPPRGEFGKLPPIEAAPTSIYSDSQPLFTVLATCCAGQTHIVDGVWSSRYAHVDGLVRLGARIEQQESGILIKQSELRAPVAGVDVVASDLRCAAALLSAGLIAPGGPVTIHGIDYLYRGYEGIIGKLVACHPASDIWTLPPEPRR